MLKPKDIAELGKERKRTSAPFRTLATKYGLSVWTIHNLCTGRQQKKTGLNSEWAPFTNAQKEAGIG